MSDKEATDNQKLYEVAREFNKKLSQFDEKTEKAFIDDVINKITEPRKKIPEPVFREIFLPYFLGERKMKDGEEAIAHWAGLVGSASDAADIVDVKGEVLFTVPPVYDTSLITTLPKERRMGMSAIFSEYVENAALHPALGNKVLSENLAKNTKYINKRDNCDPSWASVLEYYGLTKKEENKTSKSSTDDDLEFEDE